MRIQPSTMAYIKLLGRAASIGMAMVLAVLIGFGVGWWVDDAWPRLAPWGKLVGLGMGVVAAFRNLYVMFKRISRQANF